jgi:hypothetical protein
MLQPLREVIIHGLLLDVLSSHDPVDCLVRLVFGPVSITFIQFVPYCAVGSSVSWKPAVAEIVNLLLNIIALALLVLSV